MHRDGTFLGTNLKELKEWSIFGHLELTLGMDFVYRNIGRNLLVGTILGLIMELTDGMELLKFISWNFNPPKVPK